MRIDRRTANPHIDVHVVSLDAQCWGFRMTGILRLPDVCKVTGLARSTVYRDTARGSFPRPVQLGPGSVGWLESEVQAWIDSRPRAARPT
jgi:prophage regulatory protein